MSKLEQNTTALDEVLAMVNALPDAGSGGGGVETCSLTYSDEGLGVYGVYMSYVDGAYVPQVVGYPGMEETTYHNVVKNSIFAVYIGDSFDTEITGAELLIMQDSTFAAFHIKEDASIIMVP